MRHSSSTCVTASDSGKSSFGFFMLLRSGFQTLRSQLRSVKLRHKEAQKEDTKSRQLLVLLSDLLCATLWRSSVGEDFVRVEDERLGAPLRRFLDHVGRAAWSIAADAVPKRN